MEELVMYLGILLAVAIVGIGGVYIKRKFDIKDVEIDFVLMVLEIVDYLAKNFEFKYNEDVSLIIMYCYEAIDFVDEYEDIQDIEIKKELIKDKAIEICLKNNVDLGEGEIVSIIDSIIDYILVKWF